MLAQGVRNPTVLLAVALMGIIVMMILPMPSIVLDLGLTASFALAILIFTITLFIERPLDFSAFPTVLLASLMLRLSLNIASTKLIIADGNRGTHAAGGVIEGFAMFIMGGSIVLGLVVFLVLLIVNFIVITKGAGRMAEVGARFALDAMPGKQLAIDSDMAAGAISHAEASARRRLEQEETTFFGSLDGASKFVKGDAVAGLLITMLNLVVGLAVGILIHDMPIGRAFETYSILTVGDGLVSQIPAVIISLGTGLLLSKGGAAGSADRALLSQLGGHPKALGTVAGLLALLAFLPGLPFLPFLTGALALGGAAYLTAGAKKRSAAPPADAKAAEPPTARIGDMLDVDEVHMEFALDLVPVVLDDAVGLDARIVNMRNHIARSYGIIIPEIRLTDNASLPDGTYCVRIQDVEVARSRVRREMVLMLLADTDGAGLPGGETVAEPVYGAPARWIDQSEQEEAALSGLSVVSPVEVIATHLLEVLKQNFGRLFSRRALRRLMDEFGATSDPQRAAANRRVLDEFVPDKVPLDQLHAVLRLLLEERVSVRNLPMILEAIAEANGATQQPEALAEHVRHRLGFQIVAEVQEPGGTLPLIQLSAPWEEIFQKYEIRSEGGLSDIGLPPEEFNRLAGAVADKVAGAAASGRYPAIVTTTRRRRFLQSVLTAKGIRNPVLSFEEIGTNSRPAILGVA